MSTSLLYHAFNLKGITYQSTNLLENSIIFEAYVKDDFYVCDHCRSRQTIKKGSKERWFHLPPLGRKKTLLNLKIHRIECTDCGRIRWPQLPFMLGKHRYARSFALTVMDLLKFGTIQATAHYLGVGWDLIKEIHKENLNRRYKHIPINKVKYIGIDEFSIKKGHNYMTIFTDLESGRIIHAVEGTDSEAISPFLEKLGKKARKLKAISMDMSRSFYSAVVNKLPNIKVVFDHYHIAALMNKAIEKFRRAYQNELDDIGKKTIKGSRFLLLKNYESLEDDKKDRLKTLLDLNEPLFTIHTMKEQLRLLWEKEDYESAGIFLSTWCQDAINSGIKQLNSIGKTLAAYKTGILNYFEHRISNGPVEGLNNKIKTMKRQAYGFRDMEYFKLRLYHLHTQRYSLSG